MATLLAWVAYPQENEKEKRDSYTHALIRWAIMAKCVDDPDYAYAEQMLAPGIFLTPLPRFKKALRNGDARRRAHMIAGLGFLSPYLSLDAQSNSFAVLPRSLVLEPDGSVVADAKEATVENIVINIKAALGMEGDGLSSYKTKVWGPAKPVAHVAVAVAVAAGHRGALPTLLDLFWSKKVVSTVIAFAENIRQEIMGVKTSFLYRETDTICFRLQ